MTAVSRNDEFLTLLRKLWAANGPVDEIPIRSGHAGDSYAQSHMSPERKRLLAACRRVYGSKEEEREGKEGDLGVLQSLLLERGTLETLRAHRFLYGAFFVSDLREKTFTFPNLDYSPHSITLPLILGQGDKESDRLRWVANELISMYRAFWQPAELWQEEFPNLGQDHLESVILRRLRPDDEDKRVLRRDVFSDPERFAGLLAGSKELKTHGGVFRELLSLFMRDEKDDRLRLTAMVIVLGHLLTAAIRGFFPAREAIPWAVDCFVNAMAGTSRMEQELSCVYVDPGEAAWGILSKICADWEESARAEDNFRKRMDAYGLLPDQGKHGQSAEDILFWLGKILVILPTDYENVARCYFHEALSTPKIWKGRIADLWDALLSGERREIRKAHLQFPQPDSVAFRYNLPLQLVLKHRHWGDYKAGHHRGYLFVPCSTMLLEPGVCDEFSVASVNVSAGRPEKALWSLEDSPDVLAAKCEAYEERLRRDLGDLSLLCGVLHGAADYERRSEITRLRATDKGRHAALLSFAHSIRHYAGNTWHSMVVEPLGQALALIRSRIPRAEGCGPGVRAASDYELAELLQLKGVFERARNFVSNYVDHCARLELYLRPRDESHRCSFPSELRQVAEEISGALDADLDVECTGPSGSVIFADKNDIKDLLMACCGNALSEMVRQGVQDRRIALSVDAVPEGIMRVGVWNVGTAFDEKVLKNGGIGVFSGGAAEGRTGMGLFIINTAAARLLAIPPDDATPERVLALENVKNGASDGARLTFCLRFRPQRTDRSDPAQ